MVHESNFDYEKPIISEWKAGTTQTDGEPITIQVPKILPCLRCGSNNITILHHFYDGDTHTKYQCMCENDHAWDEWLDTEAEAIAAWNERPQWIMTSAEAKDGRI